MGGRPLTRRALLRALTGVAATAVLAACGGTPTATVAPRAAPPATGALNVAATTTHIQDFLKNVGGDRVVITGILRANVDPHDFEPTVQDAQAIGRADLIVVHGLGLDDFMQDAIRNAAAKAPVIVATAGITPLTGDEQAPDGDPHVWFDPTLAQKMVTNIAEGLARVDPAGAATYRQNATAYNAQIGQMDTQVQAIYNQIPQGGRKLVTNHDAFQYLARHFGLTIVGAVIPSISDAAEPTAREINDLIETIRAEKVKAIFAESSANPRLAQQVARETGIAIVDTLYADTLGEPGGEADTYLKMMAVDAKSIADALK